MSSSVLVDCSFIPDDMEFDASDKTDEFNGVEDSTSEYHPLNITHSTVSHTAVKSTFDEDDTRRKEAFAKAFEDEFKEDDEGDEMWGKMGSAMVASASSEDEENREERKKNYRLLLAELDEKEAEKDVHKEMTFDLDSSDEETLKEEIKTETEKLEAENPKESEHSEVESEKSEAESMDADDKARLEMLMQAEDEAEEEIDTDEEIAKAEEFKINTQDSRFGDLAESKYTIDMSSKEFKKNVQNEELAISQVEKRQKRRRENDEKRAKITAAKRKGDIQDSDSDEGTNSLVARLKKKQTKK